MTPEKIVQTGIMKNLAKLQKQGLPIIFERRQAGGYAYRMGMPDLYAVINGIHIEIEVKAPGGDLKPMQEKKREQCKHWNINWCCLDDASNIFDIVDKCMKGEYICQNLQR